MNWPDFFLIVFGVIDHNSLKEEVNLQNKERNLCLCFFYDCIPAFAPRLYGYIRVN